PLPEEPVLPGAALAFDLAWTASSAPRADLRLRVEAFGPAGEPVAAHETTPSAGWDTTDRWRAGEVRLARHRLAIPPNAPAGRYTLRVTLFPAGRPAETLARADLGRFGVGRNLPDAGDFSPLDVDFGLARLTGVRTGAPAGGTLPVTLRWRADRAVSEPAYTGLVHLADAAGRVVAQDDSAPQRGGFPTSIWRPGEEVADPHPIALPPGLPAGRYTLLAGLYAPLTGARLAGPGGDTTVLAAIDLPGS